MYNYNDNDDDIFDDSSYVTQDSFTSSFSSDSSAQSHSHSDKEKNFASFLDNVFAGSDRFDSNKSKVIVTFIVMFYKSVSTWINSDYDQFFQRAVIDFNTDMYENKAKPFIYYERYYATLNSVAKRRIVNLFVKEILDDPSTVTQIADNINFPLDERIIKTYFGSFYNINQYCILEDYSSHLSFAEYIGREPVTSVMQHVSDDSVNTGIYPYEVHIQSVFAKTADQEYMDLFSKNMKASIEEFVQVKEEKED